MKLAWMAVLLCVAAAATLVAEPVGVFDGKPAFAEGEGFSYYVWREGETWHLRWTTFGAMHRFTGSIVTDVGKLESLKRVDVETERRLIAPGRAPHVVVGPRGRLRGVGGRRAVVETKEQDHIDKEGDRRIVFNTRTDDDIDGFDFKVNKDVKTLRMSLQIDGQHRPRLIQAGRSNTRVGNDPIVIELSPR